MTTKIILDTDIGSDIDDAVCLAYLLAQRECELLGITTVSGEAEKRAMMASAMCKVAKKDIPIYPGCESPLLVPQRQEFATQAKKLDRWEHKKEFQKNHAIEFLRQTIRENPGDVVLLAIGPLTNIGILFAVDPEIPSLLKNLVLMCGVFTNSLPGVGPLEWNALVDPHSTAIVYNAAPKVHRSIGLDVTCRVTMDSKMVKDKFKHDLLKPVLDFAEIWFHDCDRIYFHDPLAAVSIFDESICNFKKGIIQVELQSERLRGLTYWKADEAGRHEVALDVDSDKFFDHYFSVFK
jgi:purine nucleosidase